MIFKLKVKSEVRAKPNLVKRAITRLLVAMLITGLFQSGFGILPDSANAAAILISEDGSNSSGWSSSGYYDANYPLVSPSQGNPGQAFAFHKNTSVYTSFGATGADFSGSKIKFQVKFTSGMDQFGIYWGAGAAGGAGITNSLWIGTGQNPSSGDRLSGKGGITTNVAKPNLYWHGISAGISGTGNASVTSGLWEINRWYEVEIAIGQTSTSYSIDGVVIQNKTTALPTLNVVTMGLDDRNGYNFFNGFYVDNITLTPPAPMVSAEFIANGATGTMANQVANSSGNLTANSFTKTGSTFIGWSTLANGTGTFFADGAAYSFGSNITLYAQWSSDSVPVNFNTDGGSFVAGSSVAIGSPIPAAPSAPTKNGYTFGGWQASAGGSAVTFPYYPVLSVGSSASVSAAALVDLGRYENKGTWVSSTWYGPNRNAPWSTKDFVTYTDGLKYIAIREANNTVLSNPTRLDGYYMVPLDSSTTLTAIWVATAHTITYALAGGTSTLPIQSDVLTAGSFTTAAGAVRSGYTFAGWSDGTSTVQSSTSYTVGVADVTLTALWTQNSYNVTFDSRNGVASNVSQVLHSSTATAPSAPTWFGYNFRGWSESINGTIADLTAIVISATKNFFAVWEQKSIAGLTSAQLGIPDTIAPNDSLDKSISSTLGNITTLIKVPAGSLPSTFTVKVYTLADNQLAEQTLGSNKNYLISQVVSWSNVADGTIQDTAAGKPIEMTITSPQIKSGAKVYSILGNTTVLLATATQDGSVQVTFTTDPVIVLEAAPVVVAAPTPNNGGAPAPVETPSPTPTASPTETASPSASPTPIESPPPVSPSPKAFKVLGFNPGSWKLTKTIKSAIDAFFKSLSTPSKISCVGYTAGPTVLRGDPRLAYRRGQEVCRYILATNPLITHGFTSGRSTKISSDYFRRTDVSLSK